MTIAVDEKGNYFSRANESEPWAPAKMGPDGKSVLDDGEWKTLPEKQEPKTTARGVARNIAAGAVEGGTALLNMATDPYGTIIGPTIGRVAGAAYDAGANLTGWYPPMTPEQRADLYGTEQRTGVGGRPLIKPVQPTPSDPAQQPLASRAVNAAGQVIGANPADVPATTQAEQLARKAAGAATAGGIAGVPGAIAATAGAVTGDVASREVPEWLAPATETVGNIVGGTAAQKVVTPVRTVNIPERQRLVEFLDQENVPITAGERTGSKRLQKAEQVAGQTIGSGGGYQSDAEVKAAAINRSVARRMNLDTDTLTSDVVKGHLDTLGTEIDQLATANNMQVTSPFVQRLAQARQALRYEKSDVAQEIGARIDQFRDMITVDANGNPILAGKAYQNLMSDVRDAIVSATGSAQNKLIEFRDMLRQQMETSMNPQDAAQWRDLNRYYANGKVIQHALNAAGEGTAYGNLQPIHLRNALNSSAGKDAYGRGFGDLNDWAKAGQSVLRNPTDSGTPMGTAMNKLLTGAQIFSAGAGSTAGYMFGDPVSAMGGLVAPLAVPWAIGGTMRSRPGQAYLANQLMRNVDPRVTAAIIQGAEEETRRNQLFRGPSP